MSEEDLIPESEERKIPALLSLLYVVLFLGGLWGFYSYWNGSHGWMDRGHQKQLQEAASTVYPYANKDKTR